MIIDVKELLKKEIKDEVIIFQTDTVYGIGARLSSAKGIEKIYEIKQRDFKNPLAVLCGDLNQVKALVKNVKDTENALTSYWPGALTLIFDKAERVPSSVTRGLETVGIRIPNDPIALEILLKFGPMAVTSLNISKQPPITSFKEAQLFESKVDYLVQGGDTAKLASTVYDVKNKRVLRQGVITIK